MSTESPSFVPFVGIVEDIDDPLKLGRARIRVINHHDEDIQTEDLDWANVMQPTTSSALAGAGSSPTWLVVGTTVVGFYLDGNERTVPIIMGTLATIPNNDESKHAVNALARGQKQNLKNPLGPEPADDANPQYPHNKTIVTPGGHLIELDDSPDSQRLHIRHAGGAYIEINNDGQIVIRSNDDRFDITDGDQEAYVTGDSKTTVKKDFKLIVEGKMDIEAKDDINLTSSGIVNVKGSSINLNA